MVRQQDIPPTVYLDHWALRKFSEDQRLTARLTAALESRGGTLALSWANLAEFIKVTSEEQARKAEDLIEANLPRLFFLEANPFVVIDQEDKLLAGSPSVAPPHGDRKLLKMFFVESKPESPTIFTARDLFKWPQDQDLISHMAKLADAFVERVQTLRDESESDLRFRSAVKRSAKAPPIQRGTRVILRELVSALIVDKKTKITRQHAIDFFHAVVPVAYCDLVLLDKYWEAQMDRIRSGFKRDKVFTPIAKVFSDKANRVDRFIHELELG